MLAEDKYFQTLTRDELWQRYCGFLDLSVGEFVKIQEELLMDEIERLSGSVLGNKIMGARRPGSVDEFRKMVPITNYEDYEPYLSEQREDVLAVKPYLWSHSSGKGGRFKWIPHCQEFIEKEIKACLSSFILAASSQRGEINISPGFRFLSVVAPVPYPSGCLYQTFPKYFSINLIPNPEDVKDLDFPERFKKGFQLALKDGADGIGALGSVLVRMGEAISGKRGRSSFSLSMLHPKILHRLLRAWLSSRMEKRAMQPKDIWPTKVILAGGMDTVIYREDIARLWGNKPYELYGCAEVFFLAVHSWKKDGMVFLPDTAFLEFIPYEDGTEVYDPQEHQLTTVLLDGLEAGKLYEVVVTHLYGGPLLRYRMRDLVKVVSLGDGEINLPHIEFQRRVDEVINIGGLAQLDERTIMLALNNSGIKYVDWVACKDFEENKNILRIYLELQEVKDIAEMETMIHKQLKEVDTDYSDVESYLELQPVRINLLSSGTFDRYIQEKRKEGADLAHLKPPHINPPEAVIQCLLQFSKEVCIK
ncbi:GH3 auxin-responsive promoter family protein [Chloroflexota bacterium]